MTNEVSAKVLLEIYLLERCYKEGLRGFIKLGTDSLKYFFLSFVSLLKRANVTIFSVKYHL